MSISVLPVPMSMRTTDAAHASMQTHADVARTIDLDTLQSSHLLHATNGDKSIFFEPLLFSPMLMLHTAVEDQPNYQWQQTPLTRQQSEQFLLFEFPDSLGPNDTHCESGLTSPLTDTTACSYADTDMTREEDTVPSSEQTADMPIRTPSGQLRSDVFALRRAQENIPPVLCSDVLTAATPSRDDVKSPVVCSDSASYSSCATQRAPSQRLAKKRKSYREDPDDADDADEAGDADDGMVDVLDSSDDAADDDDTADGSDDTDDSGVFEIDLPVTVCSSNKVFTHDAGVPLDQLPGRIRCSCAQCQAEADSKRNHTSSPKKKSRYDRHSRLTTSRAHAQALVSMIVDRTIRPHLASALSSPAAAVMAQLTDAELVYELHHRIMRDQLTQESLKLILGCAAGKLSTLLRLSTPTTATLGTLTSPPKKNGRKAKLPPTNINPTLRTKIIQLCCAMDAQFRSVIHTRFACVRASIAASSPVDGVDTTFRHWAEHEVLSQCRTEVHRHMFYARSTKSRGVELHFSPCNQQADPNATCEYCLGPFVPTDHIPTIPMPSTGARIFGTFVAPSRGRIQWSELLSWLTVPPAASTPLDRARLHAVELTLVGWLVDRGLMTIHLTHKQRQVARSKELDAMHIDTIRDLHHMNMTQARIHIDTQTIEAHTRSFSIRTLL